MDKENVVVQLAIRGKKKTKKKKIRQTCKREKNKIKMKYYNYEKS